MPPPPAAALLQWYDRHRRTMPWRAVGDETPDPYRVWLSEIMLQQTTVATVRPFFCRFLQRFPTVDALAAADEDSVLQAWAGLGYYARARNLHRCAQLVSAAGGFPRDLAGLRALPGIGEYTAAAIGSIAWGIPAVPVDGNVERVAARVFAVDRPLPAGRAAIAAAARSLGTDPAAIARPSDFTQALFDLGATVCTPRAPACVLCPWHDPCLARRAGTAALLPVKAPKAARPSRYGVHFWLQDESGAVLLARRPPTGLLAGMLELPGPAWRADPFAGDEILAHAPQPAPWRLAGTARHGFTHFELFADVYAAAVPRIEAAGLQRPVVALAGEALPTVMRRCIALAQKHPAQFTDR